MLFQKGHIPWNKGKKCPQISKIRLKRKKLLGYINSLETRRKMGEVQKGRKSNAWKGGKIKHNSGRWLVWKPEHPFVRKYGYIAQSRLVMEKKLNRYLTREEVVHHINGNPSDDRPENLILFSTQAIHANYHYINRPRDSSGRLLP